ncbi:MAG: hypothetical protein U0Q21_02775 [Dermatophilaceae bacterium]
MQALVRHPRLRWAVPGAAVVALVGGVAVSQAASGAGGDAPPLTARDLLVALQQATPVPFSGEAQTTLDLGLPQIPSLGGSGGARLTSLISGTHDWRVWSDGADKARLALVDGAAESDIIHSGSDVWVWSSADRTATHIVVPASTGKTHPAPALPSQLAASLADPQQAAAFVLTALDPTTRVETTSTDSVAGRAAYGLVVTPRSTTTKVGSIHLSVDAQTKLPLAVSVTARGATKPAIDVAYTAITYAAPDPSVFAFTPPPGTKVTTKTLGGSEERGWFGGTPKASAPKTDATNPTPPRIVGTGWDTVAVVTLPTHALQSATTGPLAGGLDLLPRVNGSWGSGHLLDTALVSAVLTSDGRLAMGMVAPDALYAALG